MEKPPAQTIHVDASVLDSLFKPHVDEVSGVLVPAVVAAGQTSYDVLRRLDNIEAALARIDEHLGLNYEPQRRNREVLR